MKMRIFRDPIHNYIEVSESEVRIIEHPLFQRLRRIKQLGLTHYVFHGAEHSRFGHSLGVMKVIEDISQVIELREKRKLLLRLAGLLHDIGHPPLSHTLEYAIMQYIDKTHEDYSEVIITKSSLKDVLRDEFGLSNTDIKDLALAIKGTHSDPLINQLIHSELDADRLDYLLRDSYYCGVKYGLFDYPRLLTSLRLYNSRLVVSEKGRYVVEEFLISRFYMYAQIYAHRTKRAFDLLASHLFLKLLNENIIHYPTPNDDPEELIYYDDYWFFETIKDVARGRLLNKPTCRRWARMLLNRERLKLVDESIDYVEPSGKIKTSPKTSAILLLMNNLDSFAERAGVPPDEIFIDGPEIDITKVPYKYSVEDETSILILNRDGTLEDIARDENSIIGQIARRKIIITRIYTTPENYKKVLNAWKKFYSLSSSKS